MEKNAPEKLNGSGYGNLEFIRNRINLSAVPDEVLFRYQRTGFRRFYFNPARMGRIVRDYPNPWYLPCFLPMFTVRATNGFLSS